MATFVVSTNYAGDAFGVALAASGIATRLGAGNVFRVTDNIAIQATVEMHGYTLQFANGFGIYTNTANGYLKGGFKENGNIISPLNLIFEGKSFSAVNVTTDGNSWIRGGSRWETYGLNITYQKITNHTDTCLSDNTKTYVQIFEYLSVDVLQPSFDNYLDINVKAGSTISILKLRNSNLRLISGSPTFVSGGYSWLRGQSGQQNLKLLSDVQTVSGFIPAFPNTSSGVETTSCNFTANTIEFLDSQLDGDVLLAYPPNDASINRRIKRTFKFTPKNLSTGADVGSFSARITSNRQLFGGYAGTAGNTVLYDLYTLANGASQVVEVYHATNHNTVGTGGGGAYKNATVYRVDKEITLKMRKAGYKEYTAATNTYRGEYTFATALTPDVLYSNTANNISTVTTAAQMYDVVQQYLESNLGVDIVLTRSGNTVTTTHNVLMDSNASALVSLSGNNLTIKAGTFVDNLTTTGTVTFSNGASISGSVVDANNAGSITVSGLSSTDTAEMRKASDGSLIATRTGAGAFAVSPSNVGVSVYFERKVGTALVMSTVTTPVTLTAGVNPDVPLYAGPQVQVANLDNVAKETTLQALATANQTEHDATQAAIAAIPPVNLTPVLSAVDALPTLADLAVVNNGVKNASLLIPHTTNLPA